MLALLFPIFWERINIKNQTNLMWILLISPSFPLLLSPSLHLFLQLSLQHVPFIRWLVQLPYCSGCIIIKIPFWLIFCWLFHPLSLLLIQQGSTWNPMIKWLKSQLTYLSRQFCMTQYYQVGIFGIIDFRSSFYTSFMSGLFDIGFFLSGYLLLCGRCLLNY